MAHAAAEHPMRGADELASTEPPTASCLSGDELLQLLQGELSPTRREWALEHVDRCPDCQTLVAHAGAGMQGSSAPGVSRHAGVLGIGEEISHRYRVERFIARGGMGEVYAVFDITLDERVALKTVRNASPADGKAIRRLKTEVALSRRIGHPNTCRIYEFGEHQIEGGEVIHYFTMGLVEGETLGAKLRRDGPFSSQQARLVARQVLAGLGEAHGLGILHRDLKSDNIMLRSPPGAGLTIDAVIMDFGLALQLDQSERLTSDNDVLVGSLAYMAPEQVTAEKLTPATDLYALGVILFEMLTGHLPFRGSTPAAAALRRLNEPAPAPSSIKPDIDPTWDRIVLGCLQRSPQKRFATVRDVLQALDRLGDTLPAGRVGRRRPRVIVGVMAAVAVVAALVFHFQGPARQGPPLAAASEPSLRGELQAAPSSLQGWDAAVPAAELGAKESVGEAAEAVVSIRGPRPPARKARASSAPLSSPPRTAPSAATSPPNDVSKTGPDRRRPRGPLPVDPEFPE
jgi:hypothetical protein